MDLFGCKERELRDKIRVLERELSDAKSEIAKCHWMEEDNKKLKEALKGCEIDYSGNFIGIDRISHISSPCKAYERYESMLKENELLIKLLKRKLSEADIIAAHNEYDSLIKIRCKQK